MWKKEGPRCANIFFALKNLEGIVDILCRLDFDWMKIFAASLCVDPSDN